MFNSLFGLPRPWPRLTETKGEMGRMVSNAIAARGSLRGIVESQPRFLMKHCPTAFLHHLGLSWCLLKLETFWSKNVISCDSVSAWVKRCRALVHPAGIDKLTITLFSRPKASLKAHDAPRLHFNDGHRSSRRLMATKFRWLVPKEWNERLG
jgi:hypothetical protein